MKICPGLARCGHVVYLGEGNTDLTFKLYCLPIPPFASDKLYEKSRLQIGKAVPSNGLEIFQIDVIFYMHYHLL